MSKMTYSKAQEELQNILERLENNDVEIDELEKVLKRTSELIKFCKGKLRDTESTIKSLSDDLNNP